MESNTDPAHYRSNPIFDVEPVVLMHDTMKKDCYHAFLVGNIIKYVYRYEGKNGVEDLDKAKTYIDFLKADLEGKEPLAYLDKKNAEDVIDKDSSRNSTTLLNTFKSSKICLSGPAFNHRIYRGWNQVKSMATDILRIFADGRKLLSPEAKEIIESNSDPESFANLILHHIASDKMFITKDDVIAVLEGEKAICEYEPTQVARNKRTPDVKIDYNSDITGKSISEGKIDDFVAYIQNRFARLSLIIESSGFGRPSHIATMSKHGRQEDVKLIGMVYDLKKSKNGNIIMSFEDMTGMTKVLINKTSPYFSWEFVDDEVLGVVGSFNDEGSLFFPTRIVRPEIPRSHRWEPSDSVSKVLLMSDIHLGSKEFQNTGWTHAMDWLKANHDRACIDYVVIPGDVVDGIGVYPDQENDLLISDIDNQYHSLSDALKDIPDGIPIIMSPGNHDAVRLAEPQPVWKKRFTQDFDSSVTMVANPVCYEIEGRTFYSYHGKGIDQLVPSINSVTYDNPIQGMMYMAKFRHFCPTYGGKVPLCPEKKDYLVMDKVPDAIFAGHVHKSQCGIYNGVRLIQCGCSMAQSSYQYQNNLVPDVCQFPTISLNNGVVRFHDFMKV